LLHQLVRGSGANLEDKLPEKWLWKKRHVKLIDGSTVSMPDTDANQAAYPQQKAQKDGLGFPIARLVGVLSLSTGAIIDLSLGPYQGKRTGEHALLRQLLGCFRAGDVALADAYYCSYFLIAIFRAMGVDIVCRLHGARYSDFRRGKSLGKGDHIAIFERPKRPEWMSIELYESIPKTLQVRETKIAVATPGFRVQSFVVVSTFLDSKKFTGNDLGELYRRRWHAELDLRNIKITMQMEVLRCQTPAMVRKEIWTHLLSYNLLRKIIMDAAIKANIYPREISFKRTQQTLNAYRLLWIYNPAVDCELVYENLLDAIVCAKIMNRPGRVEPRAKKRRPKQLDRLMVPRKVARERLLRKHSP
jgi:hypothetical protein